MGRTGVPLQDVRAVPPMNTTALEISHAARHRREPQKRRRAILSAIYIGTMPGFAHLPSIDLYNLLVPVGEHPIGSTVSRRTLEKHGVQVPRLGSLRRSNDHDTESIDRAALRVA